MRTGGKVVIRNFIISVTQSGGKIKMVNHHINSYYAVGSNMRFCSRFCASLKHSRTCEIMMDHNFTSPLKLQVLTEQTGIILFTSQ